MDLIENPFYILTAKTSDNRQQIMELADERSLSVDPSDCMRARSDLTNPKKRISAETAWLLGITPQHIEEILSLLHRSPVDLIKVEKLTSIARANLLAAGLSRLPDYNAKIVARWILNIGQIFEDITPEKIASLINKERATSGFPEVTDDSLLQEAIQERRQHYRQVISSALDRLSQEERIKAITQIVATATDDGELHSPVLIADLVDLFEVEAQTLLDQGEKKIDFLVNKLHGALRAAQPDSDLDPMVKELIQATKNWDILAQPIQVSTKSLGLEHDDSYRIAMVVRNLAIDMVTEHNKISFANQLTQMLREVFAEVEGVAEVVEEEAKFLDNLQKHARLAKKIASLEKKIRSALKAAQPDSDLDPMVKELIQATKNWAILAQPIQVSTKNNASYRIAMVVRSLAVHMVNEHSKISFANQLTRMLLQVFSEIEGVAEILTEDSKTLDLLQNSAHRWLWQHRQLTEEEKTLDLLQRLTQDNELHEKNLEIDQARKKTEWELDRLITEKLQPKPQGCMVSCFGLLSFIATLALGGGIATIALGMTFMYIGIIYYFKNLS